MKTYSYLLLYVLARVSDCAALVCPCFFVYSLAQSSALLLFPGFFASTFVILSPSDLSSRLHSRLGCLAFRKLTFPMFRNSLLTLIIIQKIRCGKKNSEIFLVRFSWIYLFFFVMPARQSIGTLICYKHISWTCLRKNVSQWGELQQIRNNHKHSSGDSSQNLISL